MCAQGKPGLGLGRSLLKQTRASAPMQIVAVNIVGSLPITDRNNEYLIVPGEYKLCKKIINPGFHHWCNGFTAANEWGVGFIPNGHCHALLTTKEKYSFDEIKKILKDQYNIVPDDIQAPKNVKQVLKYISKEDYRCFSTGHDKDHLSLIVKVYLYYRKNATFNPTRYPYCNLVAWQQRQFRDMYNAFKLEEEEERLTELYANFVPRRWQAKVELALLVQNHRRVLWIYDPQGGRGKTEFAKYFIYRYGGMIMSNGTNRDVAYAFDNHRYIIFDYVRSTEQTINYDVLEQLKNGSLFSAKYYSTMKTFPPVRICCMANFLPDWTKLSEDRWHVLQTITVQGETKLVRVHKPN